MRILDYTVYRGRNIYSHQSSIKMILDIGGYSEIPTKDIPDFNEKLLTNFPGLEKNHCSTDHEGGFMEKLQAGTYLAHVTEHVILEIQSTLGYNVKYGKSRNAGEPSVYYIAYEFINEICGLEAGKAAVYILNCFIEKEKVNVPEILDYLKSVSRDADLGPSTAAIVDEAKKRGIPVSRFGLESIVFLGYGKYRRILQATLTDATSCISVDIASNKQLTKSILNDHRIPVPHGKTVYSEISALLAAKQVGVPVVIKPYDGNQGKGVHLNLSEDADIKAAFKDASSFSSGVIVEKYISGKDYRVLVIGSRVCAVAERLSAAVIGDGRHSIKELIDIINQDENRGENHEKPLTKIKLDAVSLGLLKKMGLSPKYVPQADEVVKLRENGNLSTGGIAIDRTDVIHPENAELAVLAAEALGIDIAGVDFVASDIAVSIKESGGAVVEVNTAPGIRMHLYPSEGTPRNVAKDIVDYLYPDDGTMDFPIVSVTGTNGKTTTTRLIAHVLEASGKTVGLTTTSGTYINGKCVGKGDNTGPVSAKVLLSNKTIDAAVLETARGGILRAGLGYDLADVGVITNITGDHMGMGEVETLEDLAHIKSLVVEAIKKDGHAVLNAEDAMTEFVLSRVRVKTVLFTKNLDEAKKRFGDGHDYCYTEAGVITLLYDGKTTPVIPVNEIPITLNGTIPCNIENSLAAAAALFALKIPAETIAAGLKSFKDNPGRFNIFNMGTYSILLDYGHNPACYKAVIKALPAYGAKRLVGIIAMPGDRTDDAIREAGGLAAGAFQKLYIKEDKDLRGRALWETAGLLMEGAMQAGYAKSDLCLMDGETQALEAAIKLAEPGDLIVLFYEELNPLVEMIEGLIEGKHLK